MSLTDEIKSMGEMEKIFYSPFGTKYVGDEDLQIAKTSGTVATTLGTGWYQAVLGAQAWIQLNMEANMFGILPKVPWGRSGWRCITARSASIPTAGIAQDGAIPSAVYPTLVGQSTIPRTEAVVFEVTEVHDALASEGKDDNYFSMEHARTYFAVEHKEDMNAALLQDVDTVASNKFQSIDRVCSNYDEYSGCGLSNATDVDIYGDTLRSDDTGNTSWKEAYVNDNNGTARDFLDSQLYTMWRTLQTNGANSTFWFTGWDTLSAWNQLFDPQVRYQVMNQALIQPSVNGIKTVEGIGVGTKVATFLGLPIIVSKNVKQDTLSRVYLLDTSNPEGYDLPRLSLKILRPTQYFEAGVNVGRPLELAKLNTRGMYRTVGELICTFFAAQGKIRDLK
jgi:hypothetical protein